MFEDDEIINIEDTVGELPKDQNDWDDEDEPDYEGGMEL